MAVMWLGVPAGADEPLRPAADTFVHLRAIGDAEAAGGLRPVLAVKSDRPAAGNDRVVVMRFDIPADASPSGAVLRLLLVPDQEQLQPRTLALYAVAEGAHELRFDEASYAAGEDDGAVDHSPNRLREPHIVDPDPDNVGVDPVATANFTEDALAVEFQGDALDDYLRQRDGRSAAFVIVAERPEQDGSTPSVFFHSMQAGGGADLGPGLFLRGEDAAASPVPAGGSPGADADPTFEGAGAIVGTHVGFEPSEGGELALNQVHGNNTARYHFYTEDGRRFNLPAMGDSADPALSDAQARSGTHSLRLHVGPSTSGVDRDRAEFRLKHGAGDEQPFQFGQDRWYGCSLFIDPESEPPSPGRWMHVGQLWQPSTVGQLARQHEWGIPMAMSFLTRQEGWVLSLVAKSDGRRHQSQIGQLTPGQWHDLTFNVMLSHSRDDIDGHLRVWLDGQSVIDEPIDVGNYPRDLDDGFVALDAMDIRFGIYRMNQATSQTLYLDDIWFDDTPREPVAEFAPQPAGSPGGP
jgi:hypothetical protein